MAVNTKIENTNFLKKYHFEVRAPYLGVSLYKGSQYLATYQSIVECLCDMAYYYHVKDLGTIMRLFSEYDSENVKGPYLYRGSVSELFFPTERINSYVHYADSIKELFDKMEVHERRALQQPEHFEFGVQGTGIQAWNNDLKSYSKWIGTKTKGGLSDIIQLAKEEKRILPSELFEEAGSGDDIDVFISHKSDDVSICKMLYDYLIKSGYKVFLSEVSLPLTGNTEYAWEIDKALDRSNNIIVVATSVDKVLSGWVKYEWTAFANEKRGGRKEGNIISLIAGDMKLQDLPLTLRQYQVITIDNLDEIVKFI